MPAQRKPGQPGGDLRVHCGRMTPRHERALIKAILRGERAAAEELVRHHQPSLYAYMLRMTGRPEVAEDVTQEALVRALTHLHRYDERFRFSTWLFTIAKRLHVNACQRLAPAFDSETVELAAGASVGQQSSIAARTERKANIEQALKLALEGLTEDQREVVVLFYQLQWPVEQISEYLDVPTGTVKSHLHRARSRMRAALEADPTLALHVREAFA
jgi:RNA polymerase sigma-70 factor (ECF subfamily)